MMHTYVGTYSTYLYSTYLRYLPTVPSLVGYQVQYYEMSLILIRQEHLGTKRL